MSKLNIDQQTIKELFSNKKSDFLIPDYQRPYAWDDVECQTLWDDIFSFAFPDNDYTLFDSENDEYFLGPIVTFKNEDNKLEIIDGQQRLTTLMLLLRAFYSFLGNKALLEKNINIRASDYRFADKKKYYQGFVTDKGKVKEPTKDAELIKMASELSDFTEKDIIERKELIISTFIDYLKENDLLL